jgi:hypothetical protein
LPRGIESMNRGCVRERRAMAPLLCQDRRRAAASPWLRLDRPIMEALIRQKV